MSVPKPVRASFTAALMDSDELAALQIALYEASGVPYRVVLHDDGRGFVSAEALPEEGERTPHGMSGVSLSGVRRELAARVGAAGAGDPVMPFVHGAAQAVFERMKADARGDAEGVERAERRYEEIVEEARALVEEWEGPGRDKIKRRLETLLKRAI